MKFTTYMRDIIRKKLAVLDTALDAPSVSSPAAFFTKRNVLLILGIWFLFWALLPVFFVVNVYIVIS